ncbi:MAG: sulfur carrier protein ThiS [Acidobacteriota bacterium]|nr:sulfur carrier protein ThiS [Acidobacteriota bacterium]
MIEFSSEVERRLYIQVNGELREAKERSSLAELISELKLKSEQIAIELNREVVRRANWETTTLSEGDKVEIVHFVGGG